MNRQENKLSPDFKRGKTMVYESDLLYKYKRLFEEIEEDEQKVIRSINKRPAGFVKKLSDFNKDLKAYFSNLCVEDKKGLFLEKIKKMVAMFYKNKEQLPRESEKELEKILNTLLDHYKKNDKDSVTFDQLLESAGVQSNTKYVPEKKATK